MRLLLGLLPALALALGAVALARRGVGRRAALLGAAIACGFWLVVATELLSLVRMVALPGIALVWLAPACVLAVVVARGPRVAPRPPLDLGVEERAWLVAAAVAIAAIAAVAWFAAPLAPDVVAYHLSRVRHWEQARTLAHFPSNMLREVVMPPFAEIVLLHLRILSGGDRLAAFGQWFALVGCAAGTSLIARELGADRRGQAAAVVVCVTVPMVVLQSSSAKNDVVVALWLVSAIYFLLRLERAPRLENALAAGAALGLAVATKTTALLYAGPFLVWIGLRALRVRELRSPRLVAALAVAALVPGLGHAARNAATFGTPLAPERLESLSGEGSGYLRARGAEGTAAFYRNAVISPAVTCSNLLRNLTLHLATPSAALNRAIEGAVRRVHGWIGVDPDDSRFRVFGHYEVAAYPGSQTRAGNPLHLLLFAVALGLAVAPGARPRPRRALVYAAALVATAVLFSAVLRWQPYNSRLHVPGFVLAAAFSGAMLARGPRWLASVAVCGLLLAAIPALVARPDEPLIGAHSVLRSSRSDQLERRYGSGLYDAREVAAAVRDLGCDEVGYANPEGGFPEYLVWTALDEVIPSGFRLEHVFVTNRSGRSADPHFAPCAIFSVEPFPPVRVALGAGQYVRVREIGPFRLYRRAGATTPDQTAAGSGR